MYTHLLFVSQYPSFMITHSLIHFPKDDSLLRVTNRWIREKARNDQTQSSDISANRSALWREAISAARKEISGVFLIIFQNNFV